MKKLFSFFLIFVLFFGVFTSGSARAETASVKTEKIFGKKKKFKGYKKPRSKKFLGIFKRKTDCGCPNH
ncbi:hypothetical protein DYBT9275_05173 [Dyadobacter sp. CECT 9275]|uniref:Uncharacterized protein n=1 Tax=Dyadobacter helix TaxID=2822344 RepID=A0A916JJU8_9BACT|nr:hypothetical protein [Dyadobacter sp. CECT 9275]CAG5012426.1 hypothetical protein DYBT9275_05173 [Dyadobacter sp. CECT 9275]